MKYRRNFRRVMYTPRDRLVFWTSYYVFVGTVAIYLILLVESTWKPKRVLVVAHFRGGSSFTSKLIDQHSGSFYIFEPLYPIWELPFVTFLDGTVRNLTTISDRIDQSLRELQNWFDCNLYQISREALLHVHFLIRNQQIGPYLKCFQRSYNVQLVHDCVPFLQRACELSTLRLIKIIRLPLTAFTADWEEMSQVKVIYLVRDPRGILYSRNSVNELQDFNKSLKVHAYELCQNMSSNLKHFHLLRRFFPNQVKVVRYETVAMRPVSETVRLLAFVGVTPSKRDMLRVVDTAFAEWDSDGPYFISRRDPKKVPYRWLKNATRHSIRVIDAMCRDLYPSLGYLALDSMHYVITGSLYDDGFVV